MKITPIVIIITLFLFSCNSFSETFFKKTENDINLNQIPSELKNEIQDEESRFTAMQDLTSKMLQENRTDDLCVFLTNFVEHNPEDKYNAYWLFVVAMVHVEKEDTITAAYYFDRILNNYNDLLVENKSIHLAALTNLVKISDDAETRIRCLQKLITEFPTHSNLSENYMRLGLEYELSGQWENALRAYKSFLNQEDAPTIEIPGIQNPFFRAQRMINLSRTGTSRKYDSPQELKDAVVKALRNSDGRALDRCKSTHSFFAMTWKNTEFDPNTQTTFSFVPLLQGKTIRWDDEFDEDSRAAEVYLRTEGWRIDYSVWYLCFRKINFPPNPAIHGKWEWVGVYYGEKI